MLHVILISKLGLAGQLLELMVADTCIFKLIVCSCKCRIYSKDKTLIEEDLKN